MAALLRGSSPAIIRDKKTGPAFSAGPELNYAVAGAAVYDASPQASIG